VTSSAFSRRYYDVFQVRIHWFLVRKRVANIVMPDQEIHSGLGPPRWVAELDETRGKSVEVESDRLDIPDIIEY